VLPQPVKTDLDETMRDYWLKRAAQHTGDSYAGVGMSKFPEDLRVYEHLLWESAATAVIEIGAYSGGASLWFRDRLAAFARYRPGPPPFVVSIDVDIAAARSAVQSVDAAYADSIALVEADVTDPGLPDRIEDLLPAGSRCLVIEDSAHVYDTTLASLTGFARFVSPNGFFVVEDGCVDVDEMRPHPTGPGASCPLSTIGWARPPASAFGSGGTSSSMGSRATPRASCSGCRSDRSASS
jgi:cephalosporin hydroxylase